MPRAAVVEKPRSVQCQPGRMKLASHAYNSWSINAPEGVITDDLDKADFWSLLAQKLRPFDEIRIVADDSTWVAYGIVKSCSRNWAEIKVKNVIELGKPADPSVSKLYKAEWKGPERRWCVIRIKDGAILQDQIETAIQANQWLIEFESKVK